VNARAEGDHTVIESRRGRIEAPPTIVSNHPWNYQVIDRTLLFGTRRGRLQEIPVAPAGTETITVGSRALAAQKYDITGDLRRELWYDEAGTGRSPGSSTTAPRSP
jgi:hypothetical protein